MKLKKGLIGLLVFIVLLLQVRGASLETLHNVIDGLIVSSGFCIIVGVGIWIYQKVTHSKW